MNVNIICVGKLKEKYWTDAIAEYSKRLGAYCALNIVEIKEYKSPDSPSDAEIQQVKTAEGREIQKAVKPGSYTIALVIKGKELSSEALAARLEDLGVQGKSTINFIIGGSFGLSDDVINAADFKLSFSPMTFPHQMMRVILLEQIYRCFKINRHETYHK